MTKRAEAAEELVAKRNEQIDSYLELLGDEEAAGDARTQDFKNTIAGLRKDKNKLHEDLQIQMEETKRFEDLYCNSQEQINALRAEIKFLQSNAITKLKEDMEYQNNERQKEIALQFKEQKELLEREVAHYKKKCVQIETTMRNQSDQERRKMALDIQAERKAKVAEQMKRAFGGMKADMEKQQIIEQHAEIEQIRKEEEKQKVAQMEAQMTLHMEEQLEEQVELSKEGETAIIQACENGFEEERRNFQDQLEEQQLLFDQKDVLHRRELAEMQEKMNKIREEMRESEKALQHYRDLERLHMKQIKQEKEQRMATVKKVTQLAKLANMENLNVLKSDNKEEWQELKHRANNVYNTADPTQKMMQLLTGAKTIRTPKLDPTLLEDKTDHEKEWSVFGEIRELNQALADVHSDPIRPKEDPLYSPSFEFEKLYEHYAHNEELLRAKGIGYLPDVEDLIDIQDEASRMMVGEAANEYLHIRVGNIPGGKKMPQPTAGKDSGNAAAAADDPFGVRKMNKNQLKAQQSTGSLAPIEVDIMADANEKFVPVDWDY